ncbi:MAG: 4Fe-4S binding protein [Prevotellaceae bacterium]|nr:4Fe-4S binding protein [Prevotellaceae bacterium]MDO4932715.1 4Fe-4S binding protein [Prevotellaceae bacterium]
MANNNSYFGGIIAGLKTLVTGMDITMGEYVTPKITEQYPENRKTQHVAERHRGKLIMPHDENGKNKCIACTLCEKACPNGSIKIVSQMVTTAEGKKKKLLTDYQYDLGDCMFCQLCVNACPHDAIKFVKDFENAVFNRDVLKQHLNIPPTQAELDEYAENARKAAAKAAEAPKVAPNNKSEEK